MPYHAFKLSFANRVKANYNGRGQLSTIMTDSALELIDEIVNKDGQLRIENSKGDYFDQHLNAIGLSLSEWAKTKLKDSETNLEVFVGASLLQDNIFKTLYGTVSSAISVYDSYLSIRSYRWQ